ncbi:MAG TPA: tyrosinase family protein, partial [Pyrinomonadaceae bacterium]|nr:tyrosinase family protein [Pyrinomonadaceae bacterium]
MENSNENIYDLTSRFKSRREFIQLLGLGPMVLGAEAITELVFPQKALATYELPENPGRPKLREKDCRHIRPRRPASTLSDLEIEKLKCAYRAMRALDVSDPRDPRGFRRQADIHRRYNSKIVSSPLRVHGNWQFLVFHRAYLYFHERILGKLIDDMEFRLPCWDWEVSSHRKIPVAYSSPNDGSNPLWNPTREMGPAIELPDEDVGEDVMEVALTAGTFDEFGGTTSSSGIFEKAPHRNVHIDVGGDMRLLNTAAKDPIFYAHHSNIDKIWSDWNKASSAHANPTSSVFLNLSWNFFDENKVWRKITAAQVLDHESQLRYTYGSSTLVEGLPRLQEWVVVKTDWKHRNTLNLTETVREILNSVLENGGRVRMHLTNLVVPLNESAVYRLYSGSEAA